MDSEMNQYFETAFDRSQPPQVRLDALEKCKEILAEQGVSLDVTVGWTNAPEPMERMNFIEDEIRIAKEELNTPKE